MQIVTLVILQALALAALAKAGGFQPGALQAVPASDWCWIALGTIGGWIAGWRS